MVPFPAMIRALSLMSAVMPDPMSIVLVTVCADADVVSWVETVAVADIAVMQAVAKMAEKSFFLKMSPPNVVG